MANLYRVVFTGRLQAGIDPKQAVSDFASVFKVPLERASELVLDGKEHVLKREVDDANARRYREILEDIGLEIRIEPAHGGPDTTARPLGARAQTTADPAAFRPETATADAPFGAEPRPRPGVGATGEVMTGPSRVQPGHGWQWLERGYSLFVEQPWIWIGNVGLLYLINLLLGLLPGIGFIVTLILGPIFLGGLLAGAQTQERGGQLRFGHLFEGFTRRAGDLAAVGGLYLIGFILIGIAIFVIFMVAGGVSTAELANLSHDSPELAMATMGPMVILALLVLTMLSIPLIMAYWFAPALVMLAGMRPVEAMIASFQGCLKNVMPFLIYGLVIMGVAIGAAILFGLLAGIVPFLAVPILIALVPLSFAAMGVVLISIYAGYRDIYFNAMGRSRPR